MSKYFGKFLIMTMFVPLLTSAQFPPPSWLLPLIYTSPNLPLNEQTKLKLPRPPNYIVEMKVEKPGQDSKVGLGEIIKIEEKDGKIIITILATAHQLAGAEEIYIKIRQKNGEYIAVPITTILAKLYIDKDYKDPAQTIGADQGLIVITMNKDLADVLFPNGLPDPAKMSSEKLKEGFEGKICGYDKDGKWVCVDVAYVTTIDSPVGLHHRFIPKPGQEDIINQGFSGTGCHDKDGDRIGTCAGVYFGSIVVIVPDPKVIDLKDFIPAGQFKPPPKKVPRALRSTNFFRPAFVQDEKKEEKPKRRLRKNIR